YDMVTPFHECPGAGCTYQCNTASWRQAALKMAVIPGTGNQALDIVEQMTAAGDRSRLLAHGQQISLLEAVLHTGQLVCAVTAVFQQDALSSGVGITNFQPHQKTVKL